MAEVYDSANLRKRDRQLLARHQDELAQKDARYERLKRVNEDLMKEKHAQMARAERLAQVLGFRDLQEAFVEIDLAEQDDLTYKGTLELVDRLKGDLKRTKLENDDLMSRLEETKGWEKQIQRLQSETDELRARYEELNSRKERAAAYFLKSYAKWKRFKHWLFDKETRRNKAFNMKREDLLEMLKDDGGDLPLDFDEMVKSVDDNGQTASSSLPHRHRSVSLIRPSADKENRSAKRARSLSTSPSKRRTPRAASASSASRISRTLFPPSIPKISAFDSGSDTEESSPSSSPTSKTLPLKPCNVAIKQESPIRPSTPPIASSSKQHIESSSRDECTIPAPHKKKRRISDQAQHRFLNLGSLTSPRRPSVKPEPETPSAPGSSTASLLRELPSTLPPPRKKLSITKDKAIDYSKFKGRGRYSNAQAASTSANPHTTTINAAFAIDRTANDGFDFEYSNVVRGKEKRKRLHGEDCECCKDYYEGVGPLPPRLQAPLWKSPEPVRKTVGSGSGLSVSRGVLTPRRERKKKISRHRGEWKRARTPPDYWNIGFPDTQEVAKINDKARDMREERWADVERDERYLRR